MPLDLAKQFVRDVTFRSQVTPDYTWDPFAPAVPPEQRGFWPWVTAEVVKPAAYVRTPQGQVLRLEPYGAPNRDYLPTITVGTLVATGVVVWASFAAGAAWERRKGRQR